MQVSRNTGLSSVSAGNDRPVLMMAGRKGGEKMTIEEFKGKMLACACGAAKVLCEMTLSEDIKKEPEQVRKNVATILMLLTEVEDYLNSVTQNTCSDSTT